MNKTYVLFSFFHEFPFQARAYVAAMGDEGTHSPSDLRESLTFTLLLHHCNEWGVVTRLMVMFCNCTNALLFFAHHFSFNLVVFLWKNFGIVLFTC
jgi:hypothetical protein